MISAPASDVIEVNIILLKTQRSKDFIFIGDGEQSFSKDAASWKQFSGYFRKGSERRHFTTENLRITVIFASDERDSSVGFMIEFIAINPGKKIFDSNFLPHRTYKGA